MQETDPVKIKFYEAVERFSIMAEQSDVGEVEAAKYIQAQYGRPTAVAIWRQYASKR